MLTLFLFPFSPQGPPKAAHVLLLSSRQPCREVRPRVCDRPEVTQGASTAEEGFAPQSHKTCNPTHCATGAFRERLPLKVGKQLVPGEPRQAGRQAPSSPLASRARPGAEEAARAGPCLLAVLATAPEGICFLKLQGLLLFVCFVFRLQIFLQTSGIFSSL